MKGLYYLGCFLAFCLTLLWTPVSAYTGVEDVLYRLAQRCRESKSDSVLVTRQGRVIFEYRSDLYWEPIDTLSLTKSIVALAIGMLIDEGKIASIHVPVADFYPEWNQGNKRYITIRHLLSHTSGLQCDFTTDEIYSTNDIIQMALCAELMWPPGTHYHYNNKAVNLLSGIVTKASGMSLSEYLSVKLFTPLGIENVSWLSDPCGTDYAMSHLIITAPDLARIGEMLANGGLYCNRRFVSCKWIDMMFTPSQCYDPFSGLLWWLDYYNMEFYWDDSLLDEYLCRGVSCDFVERLRGLCGRVMYVDGRTTTPRGCNFFNQELVDILGGPERTQCFYRQVMERQLPIARWTVGALRSYSARGYLGQQLIIFPGKSIVAVRQIRSRGYGEKVVDPFHDFGALVEELAYRMGQ